MVGFMALAIPHWITPLNPSRFIIGFPWTFPFILPLLEFSINCPIPQYIHVPIDIAMNIPVNIAIHIVITYYKVGLPFIGCE